jgi:hypothetical protein
VQLDGNDASAGIDQQRRYGAGPRPYVEHERAGSYSGLLHEECRPPVIELVKAPPLLLPPGHDGP